ncbi:4Fe-4S binding protein [Rhodobacter xanthinilyticus]|uniref:4Fe-4S binding protein n=1 Tax=Rhodobacter xanthinilyticus TaxID=1850250 RepID=UPI0009F4F206|nr:4Fe-4S binding protein [Rhodobacter xanthinilyticus]
MVTSALPRLAAGSCTAARLSASSCAACIEACPHGALEPIRGGLQIEPERCSGCGLCAAACPESALSLPGSSAVAARRGGVALALCPRHPQGDASRPCAHALSLNDLATLLAEGVHRIALASGDCATCPDKPPEGHDLSARTAQISALAEGRGLAGLGLAPASHAEITTLLREAPENPARRNIFKRVATPETQVDALARLQAEPCRDSEVFAATPRIDANRCTGCEACLRICPHGVLIRIKDDEGNPCYRTEPAACTGCGLCADVCDEDALQLAAMAPAPPDVPLQAYACRGCGVSVHEPAAHRPANAEGGLCPVCRRTGHHRKLFQVLS